MMKKPIHEMEEFQRLNKVRFSQLSFYVFQKNYADLKGLFDFFCNSREGFQLTNVVNRHKLDVFQDELIRATHNFVAAVGSLVDHTRKFYEKHYENAGTFPDYQKKINEIFVNDELASFVKDYRNYCLHYASPNLSTGIEMIQGKGTWQFIRANPSELLAGSFEWKSASKKFLAQYSAPFDLPPIFETYFSKVVSFYQWFYQRLSEIHRDDQQKVSDAQRAARKEMAPQIMMILKMELEDNSLPVGLDELLAGFLPPDKLSELEPQLGSKKWTEAALKFLVENEVISPEFSAEILKKHSSEKAK